MPRVKSRRALASAMLVALALACAACASSSGGDSKSGTPSSSKPTGAPINAFVIGPFQTASISSFQGIVPAIQATADAINAAGGVAGRPIQVTGCNDQEDSTTAGDCARQAVSDKATVVFGGYSIFGTIIVPILQAAGIPYVAGYPYTSAEATPSNTFPFDASAPIWAGVGNLAVQLGCKKVATVFVDTTSSHSVQAQVTAGINGRIPVVDTVYVPDSVPDYSTVVTTAKSKGADCVVPGIGSAEVIKLMTALHELAPGVKVIASNAVFSPATISQLGSLADNVHTVGQTYQTTDTEIPIVVEANTAIKQYDGPNVVLDNFSVGYWSISRLVFSIMKNVGKDVDATNLLQALSTTTTGDFGSYAPFNMSEKGPIAAYPTVRNFSVLTWHVQGGKLVLDSPKFTNVAQYFES